jgi:hypothetical protein
MSPTQRLLVSHQIGSGKTLTMLNVLDNFYTDSRPKIVIFPSDVVVTNFYNELLKFPSRWRDYFAEAQGIDWQDERYAISPSWTRGVKVADVLAVLEMKRSFRSGKWAPKYREEWKARHPDCPLPAAPLRAYRYTIAGGASCILKEGKVAPENPLLKIMFDGVNPYSNKVVVLDEIHNLVRPTQWKEQLQALRDMLMTANNTALLGVTGTPVQTSTQDIERLLKVVKGPGPRTRNDEGFVSCFLNRPEHIFPQMTMVVPKLTLRDGVLHKYLEKYKAFSAVEGKLTLQATKEKLGGYCNMSLYYTQHSRPAMQRVLNDPLQHAPKLQAAADLVIDAEGKCAVFCHRRRGLYAFVRLLQHRGNGIKIATIPEAPNLAALNLATIKDFNSPENVRGECVKVGGARK